LIREMLNEMKWKKNNKYLMPDKQSATEYSEMETEYKIAADLISLRLARGLTQAALAEKINTRQSSIARLESGNSLPSLSMLLKAARALNANVEITVKPKSE
jgi:DNA-binding XRE family transcriptional regulator